VIFRDRVDAGRQLAAALAHHRSRPVVVLGIPRGGVPVAAEVARALGAELDVVVARKVGLPGQEECALGAVTADGKACWNDDLVAMVGIGEDELAQAAAHKASEAAARERSLRGTKPAASLRGKVAILVDDGLATGATMRAAVRSARERGASQVVVAAPVGSREASDALRASADEVICLSTPPGFRAVGLHYEDFTQTSDAEVKRLLA
jgi:putative phosphoribosyl transferase